MEMVTPESRNADVSMFEVFRTSLVTSISSSNSDRYDEAAEILKGLLESPLTNQELNYIVTTIIGFYQDDFLYGAKIFSQLSAVNLRPLRMYKYLIDNIPNDALGYLSNGPNVSNNGLFNCMIKDKRCWLYLITNPYLSISKRKRIMQRVNLYINEDPVDEYKAVLYRQIHGGLLGKNLDLLDLPVSDLN